MEHIKRQSLSHTLLLSNVSANYITLIKNKYLYNINENSNDVRHALPFDISTCSTFCLDGVKITLIITACPKKKKD